MTTSLSHVTLSYGNKKIINDLSISFQDASFNLLIGASGIGKSTFLRVLAGFYPQLKGEVIADNTIVDNLPANQRARHVGMLFQDPNTQFAMPTPFDELVFTLENLQVPQERIQAEAQRAIDFVGINQLSNLKINTLSGGEKQKVALAVIVAMQSKVLLLDEPFANIDQPSRRYLLKKVKQLQADGTTIIVVDHDLSGYEDLANQVWLMADQTIQAISESDFKKRLPTKQVFDFAVPTRGAFVCDDLKVSVGDRKLFSIQHLLLAAAGITLLTGDNGTGKSTLFNALTRLKDYEGEIAYLDRDISKLKVPSYLKEVALVFQNSEKQYLRMTVDEELALSLQQTRHPENWQPEAVAAYLQRLNMSGLGDHIVYQLSGGQKKKLQLFVMLIMETPVLLLDEPLAGLDFQSVRQVAAILREIADRKRQRFVIISHQLDQLLPVVDFYLRLENQTLHYQERLS
ncbi:MAG: ABC transporter ATP-binding protein [Oenococcus sp.]|uniref:ABC transporter ATP-binding protein n=1 Tax=Oenococcus TaxID=46254 RepID=UPI0021E8D9E0|nr:ABC transporter ATP-binding protein [Oenococcus kitaharae]MCV3296591.1 energy-coupling factor ABC transporter ATP-binding protein [Oenococcus kitaharae]